MVKEKFDNTIIKKINISGNGKGKEYDKYGYLIFEGEYLYGDRNGKGKEYWNNNTLKFEGEYLNEKEMEKERNIIVMVN